MRIFIERKTDLGSQSPSRSFEKYSFELSPVNFAQGLLAWILSSVFRRHGTTFQSDQIRHAPALSDVNGVESDSSKVLYSRDYPAFYLALRLYCKTRRHQIVDKFPKACVHWLRISGISFQRNSMLVPGIGKSESIPAPRRKALFPSSGNFELLDSRKA